MRDAQRSAVVRELGVEPELRLKRIAKHFHGERDVLAEHGVHARHPEERLIGGHERDWTSRPVRPGNRFDMR